MPRDPCVSFTTSSPLHHSIFTRAAQTRASLLRRCMNLAITLR